MAKDPATLWYWNDWNGGTVTFSRHLKGCYMDLLYAQFNNGRLSLAQVKTVLGGDFGLAWPCLQAKFKRDENDNYYNERSEIEKEKRRKFTESRRKNLRNAHMEQHMEAHMENANVSGFKEEGLGETIKGSNLFRQPKIPTKQEVLEAFINQGGTKEMAKQFYNKHHGAGWFLNGSPIVNFSSLAANFIENWNKNRNKESGEPDQSYRLKTLPND